MRFAHWRYTLPLRLRSIFRRSTVERELDDELRFHIERQVEINIARGMTPEQARTAALRAMGGVEQRKEECRDQRRVNVIENLFQDVRYGARWLVRSPGFTITAILSLALGIGANAAMFQLLDAVGLRSLPIANPQELVEVRIAGGHRGFGVSDNANSRLTNPLWEQIREHQSAFSGVFAWGTTRFPVGRMADAQLVRGLWVSGEFFSVLGVRAARGRLFTTTDDRRGCGPGPAVISHAFWRSHFGARDSAIGTTLTILDQPFQVVGVTPPEFLGLDVGRSFDVALPLCAAGIWGERLDRRHHFWLTVMGRLKPGWNIDQAAPYVNALSPGLFEATIPSDYSAASLATYRGFRLTVEPAERGVSQLRTSYQTALWLLLGMTGMVLLIACGNLANLMLGRASAREREIAVRVALGASRIRIVSQMAAESVLLSAIGAAIAVVCALWFSQSLMGMLSTAGDPLQLELTMDWRVVSFTALVGMLTCLVFGLVPALRASHVSPRAAMWSAGRGLTVDRRRFSFQRLLVVGQVAFSLVLITAALLFVRSFRNLITVDAGLKQDGILFAYFGDVSSRGLPRERLMAFQRVLLQEVQSIPQVESAASSTHLPLTGGSWTQAFRLADGVGDERRSAKFTYVSPGYFETLQIPVLAGRDISDFDTARTRGVIVVNETFVRRFIPARNPLGTSLRTFSEPGFPEAVYEVIGIVGDSKYADLREEIPPVAFVPLAQHPNLQPWPGMIIRSSAPEASVVAEVKRKVSALNPSIAVGVSVLKRQIDERLGRERLMAWLTGVFGALAIFLAMVGLYGVMSYRAVRRRSEIGIRLSLGATRASVVRLVLTECIVLVALGLAIGAAASSAAVRGASSLLFGLSAHDVPTQAAAVLLLATTAGIASWLPAWRASRLDPTIALRHE